MNEKGETMDRRTFIRTSAGAAGALWLASCTRNGGDGVTGTPVPPSDVTKPSLRPTLRGDIEEGSGLPFPFAYSPATYGIMTYLYDTLLLADSTGAVIPWLASSHGVSPDGLVHTLELRDNVRWHDGRPFSADDVAFTFDYFADQLKNLPPFVLFRPDGVAEARANGPRNVTIRLTRPQVNFARDILATFPIAPRHIWSSVAVPGEVEDQKLLVGTGPYLLRQYDPAKSTFLFEANDSFFLGKPFVKRLELKPVPDPATGLLAGEIDSASFDVEVNTTSTLRRFQRDRSFGVLRDPLDFAAVLYFDQTKGAPLNDVRFRRACALGINRQDLVRRVLGGLGEPGNPGFLTPDHPFHVKVEQYEFNRRQANRLLDEAGLKRGARGMRSGPDGKPLSLEMAVVPEVEPTVEVVIGQLRTLGIDVKIRPVDPFMLFSGQIATPLALHPHGGMRGDPDFMRVVFSSRYEKRFFAPKGYANPELDDLADRQQTTLDEAQRKQIIARMQELVAADLPYLHLYYTRPYTVFKKAVFDQWSSAHDAGPTDKDTLVTGTKAGGTEIRPIKEG